MNKNLVIFLGLLLVSSCVFAQIEDDDVVVNNENADIQVEHQTDDNIGQHFGTGDDAAQDEPNPEELMKDESFKERIRNLYVSCIVTSRHKLNNYGQELMTLIKSVPDQQSQKALYNKMLAEYIYACALYGTQNPNTPEQIIKTLQDKTFKVEDWDVMYMSIDFNKYKDANYPVALTDDESNILKFVDQFDEAMKQQTGKTAGEPGEEDEDIPFFGQQAYEPKIGSFSLSNLSAGTQMIYFFLIIAVFGGIIIYGYKKIDDEGPKIKSKKDKKKTK